MESGESNESVTVVKGKEAINSQSRAQITTRDSGRTCWPGRENKSARAAAVEGVEIEVGACQQDLTTHSRARGDGDDWTGMAHVHLQHGHWSV